MIHIKIYLLIFLSATFFSHLLFSQQAALVEVDRVIQEKISQSVPIIGSIKSKNIIKIMAPVNGVVDKIYVEEGQFVKKGQLLASIDSINFKLLFDIEVSNFEKAKANLENAKIEAANSQLDLKRIKALKASSAFNEAKFDKIKNSSLIGKFKKDIALKELNIAALKKQIAELNFSKSKVRATVSGVIEEKTIEIGEVANFGDQMFELVNNKNLEIFAEIPSFRASSLKVSDEIKVATVDNLILNGNIRAIGSKENITTRTIKLFLDFNTNDVKRNLFVGENVNLQIPVSKDALALTIHKDAILKREGISLAYVVKGNKVEIKPIKLGEAVDNRFILLQGIEQDSLVVIKGNERLRPGQEIRILEK